MLRRALTLVFIAAALNGSAGAQDMPIPVPVATELVEQISVDYEGIHFRFDAQLADSVSVVHYPSVESDGPMPSPAYTEFTFGGYAQGEYLNYAPMPRIDVFGIEDFGSYPYYIDQLDQLSRLLAERPDLNQYVVAETGNPETVALPFLPAFAAAQVLRAQPEYVDVPGIRGIRYLVYYSQAPNPITEGEIFYTFQGITDDGQHYVSAILPLNTGVIPAEGPTIENPETFAQQYQQYLTSILQGLTTTQSDTFTPALSTLDALAQSIQFNGFATR